MGKLIDLTGKKYGRLTVVGRAVDVGGKSNKKGVMWRCICDCGNEAIARGDSLKYGDTKSCGCLNNETRLKLSHSITNFKHGDNGKRLYGIYISMKQRCYNEKNNRYLSYGGRGISVCDEWLDKESGYINFRSWALSNGYSEKLTIDRIDVNGNYEPSNCKWSTIKEQDNNRRNTIRIALNNEIHTISEWSEITGIKRNTIASRYHNGWCADDILRSELNTWRDIYKKKCATTIL